MRAVGSLDSSDDRWSVPGRKVCFTVVVERTRPGCAHTPVQVHDERVSARRFNGGYKHAPGAITAYGIVFKPRSFSAVRLRPHMAIQVRCALVQPLHILLSISFFSPGATKEMHGCCVNIVSRVMPTKSRLLSYSYSDHGPLHTNGY